MKPYLKILLQCGLEWLALLHSGCQPAVSKQQSHSAGIEVPLTQANLTTTASHPIMHIPKELLAEKQAIDLLAADTNRLIVLVKVPEKRKLVKVLGNHFPEEIETTYNILKDKAGSIIYTVEIPESESGDWFITYTSYYHTNGKLFAFERQAGYFNGECTVPAEEPLHERLIKYFDEQFHVAGSIYGLKDSKNKLLKKASCQGGYDHPYTITRTTGEFIRRNHINL